MFVLGLQVSNGIPNDHQEGQCMKGRTFIFHLSIRSPYVHSVEKYVTSVASTNMDFVFGTFLKTQMHHLKDVRMWPNQVDRLAHSQYQKMKRESKNLCSIF